LEEHDCFFTIHVLPINPTLPEVALSIPLFSEVSFSYSFDLRKFAANPPDVVLNVVNVFNLFRYLENQISEIEHCTVILKLDWDRITEGGGRGERRGRKTGSKRGGEAGET